MMNSKAKANIVINDIFTLIDGEYFNHFIDEPIDKAMNSFVFKDTETVTTRSFIRITGRFVRHIYKYGLGIKQDLSDPQARAIALNILEEGYQGPHARGYEAALLDASDSELTGIEFILTQMADYIKIAARQKHVRCVFLSQIEYLDWNTRCLIAEILLEKWERFLPPNILGCSSSQLASHLPELINSLSSIEGTVEKLMGNDIGLNIILKRSG